MLNVTYQFFIEGNGSLFLNYEKRLFMAQTSLEISKPHLFHLQSLKQKDHLFSHYPGLTLVSRVVPTLSSAGCLRHVKLQSYNSDHVTCVAK